MKEKIISQKKGKGKIIYFEDRFGEGVYILFDGKGNFTEKSYNCNVLLRKLWR